MITELLLVQPVQPFFQGWFKPASVPLFDKELANRLQVSEMPVG